MLTTLIVVFGLCVLAVIHPYITYPLSLIAVSFFKKVPLNSTGPAPASYALISCAHNERAAIEQKVENLLQSRDRLGNCEILVHSDGSVDGTTEYLKSREGEICISVFETRSGKTAGINKLMSMTTAEIVILSDANVMIDLDSIKNIERYFRDPTVGCVACKLVYTNEKESDTAEVGSKYRRFEEYAKAVET
ncbi:MAG: glycosyltransferase, partial [Dongiaceae bacterium]